MNLVGYDINGPQKYQPGAAYDYIMAGDGVWIRANNQHLTAAAPVAMGKVRGLCNLVYTGAKLLHGKVPQRFFDLALSVMLARPEIEAYIAIAWTGSAYQLVVPEQERHEAGVRYQCPEHVVVEMHSHPGKIGPSFSETDRDDEQGLKIYGVISGLNNDLPSVSLRLGCYGYFMPVRYGDVFDGEPDAVIDTYGLVDDESDIITKEEPTDGLAD